MSDSDMNESHSKGDDVLRRMLKTPPKPDKAGKPTEAKRDSLKEGKK